MTSPPRITSREAYVACRVDVAFWRPYVAEILARHGLGDVGPDMRAGFNPTYPTFLIGDVVVKLLGCSHGWRKSYAAERAAHAVLLQGTKAIAAPRLLAEGDLCNDAEAPWPYLVTTLMPGCACCDADLSREQRLQLAADLGRVVRNVHTLRPSEHVATPESWSPPDVASAAARTSLPPHLVAQVASYVARLGPPDRVFVHGDLGATHVFVEDGCLQGLIDWGDALVADRHYELINLYGGPFDCDKALLSAFLEAYDWPVEPDFANRVLGRALQRQALGLAQHHGMDVFHSIAARYPLHDFGTLDELAAELFQL